MRTVRLVARAEATRAEPDLEDRFGSRWNARRPIHPEAGPLVQAVAGALEAAGWWRPGGPAVEGGLVVGVDVGGLDPAARFVERLADPGVVKPPPSEFLFALPSSAAAVVGVALGLVEYQATVAMHGLSGFRAVAHAIDRIRLGRLERAVVAALTRTGPAARAAAGLTGPDVSLAVAWCLEAGEAEPGRPAIEAGPGDPGRGLDAAERAGDLPAPVRGLAAPSLAGAGRWIETARACTVFTRDPLLAELAWIQTVPSTPE